MKIVNFLLMNWDSVLVVLTVIAVFIVLYARGEKKLLGYILYTLVTEAERQYGSGTGELKKAAVISWVHDKLPAILKIIITETRLSELIEKALAFAKAKWAENAAIGDYIKQEGAAETVVDKPPGVDTYMLSGKYII